MENPIFADVHYLSEEEKKFILSRKRRAFILLVVTAVLSAVITASAIVFSAYNRNTEGAYAQGAAFFFGAAAFAATMGSLIAWLMVQIHAKELEGKYVRGQYMVLSNISNGNMGRARYKADNRIYYTCSNESGLNLTFQSHEVFDVRKGDRVLVVFYSPLENILTAKYPAIELFRFREFH